MSSETDLTKVIEEELCLELSDALQTIRHCVDQLSDEQVWWRPDERMNSIANLMLHLAGNIRQWIIAGLPETEDRRQRQAEFDDRSLLPKTELLQQLADTVDEAQQVIRRAPAEQLVRPRLVQGFEVTGLGAVVKSVAHFRGHVQEIVHQTREQLGDRYRFNFVPEDAAPPH